MWGTWRGSVQPAMQLGRADHGGDGIPSVVGFRLAVVGCLQFRAQLQCTGPGETCQLVIEHEQLSRQL
jgi:hypothetical protein